MKKTDILLSPDHPSLLENSFFPSKFYAPLILDRQSVLIDGYRRFQIFDKEEEVSATLIDAASTYHAALELNRNTRRWDELDLFLWIRWARAAGIEDHGLPAKRYPEGLYKAPGALLSALANRALQLGQAIRILEAPSSTCSLFTELLSSRIHLNVNETADFIDMMFDLANRWNTKNLQDVLENDAIRSIMNQSGLKPRQKGETLLKEMRKLRYPLYQRKSEDLSRDWHQLHLDQMQVKRALFLDRGVLEITIRARSQQEMTQQVTELYESLGSAAWKRIWDHER